MVVFGLALVPAQVKAFDLFPDVCEGDASDSTICKDEKDANKNENPVVNMVANIVTIVTFFAGVAAVLTIMFGGFRFVTSNGDPARAASGRQAILYAVAGLIVIILARWIVLFIISKV